MVTKKVVVAPSPAEVEAFTRQRRNFLCLAGGGYKGCYQRGVLEFLDWNNYDAVFGTSVGALNGLAVAMDNKQLMLDLWNRVESGYRFHKVPFWNYLAVPFGRRGLATNLLFGEVEKILGSIVKPYYVTVVDEDAGCLHYVKIENSKDLVNLGYKVTFFDRDGIAENLYYFSKQLTAKIIVASTTIPIMFSPVDFYGMQLVDGGVMDKSPLSMVSTLGATEVLLVSCDPSFPQRDDNLGDLLKVGMRSIDLLCQEVALNDERGFIQINEWLASGKLKDPDYRKIGFDVLRPDRYFIKDSMKPTNQEITEGIKMGQAHVQDYLSKNSAGLSVSGS
jgi:NTE family protein